MGIMKWMCLVIGAAQSKTRSNYERSPGKQTNIYIRLATVKTAMYYRIENVIIIFVNVAYGIDRTV